MLHKFTTLQLNSEFEVYNNENDLPATDFNLLQQAKKSLIKAYAPYSNFLVGAAVLLENGSVVCGNNQENAAYPSGLCAERVALFYASAEYNNVPVVAIAISYKSPGATIDSPISPCGSCRQVIAEYEEKHDKKIRVIMGGESGKVFACNSVNELLPLAFNRKSLK